MKLYYSPNACSMAIHVILEEIGAPYELALVSLREGAQHEAAYAAVNPKAKVPALDRGDGGPVLTELPAIAMWLGATNPGAKLWPGEADAQARCLEMLDYVAGTVHPQAFTRQFRPANFTVREEDHPKAVETGRANAKKYFDVVEGLMAGDDGWWLKTGYSVADAALFFVTYWQAKRVGDPMPPKVAAHFQKMLARPAVQRALQQEGLSA